MKAAIPITGDPDADKLLVTDPLALLLGMLLDQQVPMEWAFKGPWTLRARLGGQLDARKIAAMEPEAFVDICRDKPAIHRFPGSMGKRAWEVCQVVAEQYDGDASNIWSGASSGDELYARLRELPGYGEEKAKIFIAILGKRLGVAPAGWQEAAAPFSDEQPRSVADVADAETLAQVRQWKKAKKAANKTKQD
jgi:uncharacterized HhH-GPD family protein